jgi:hypothetical protein
MATKSLSDLRREIGRRGGNSTLRNYGKEHFKQLALQAARARGIEPLEDMKARIEKEKKEVDVTLKNYSQKNFARVLKMQTR